MTIFLKQVVFHFHADAKTVGGSSPELALGIPEPEPFFTKLP